MPVALRLLTSGLTVSLGQWGLAIASLAAMGLEPTTWWLGLSGVLTAAISVVAYRLLVRPPPDRDEGDDRGPAAGGPDDDPEPPWWPEFERAFREQAARPRSAPDPVAS